MSNKMKDLSEEPTEQDSTHTHTPTKNNGIPSLLCGTSSMTLSLGMLAGGIFPRSIRYVSRHGVRFFVFFWKKRKMDAPSMCDGTGNPAISRKVGAISTLPTRLWTTRPCPIPGPRTRNGTRMSNSKGNDFPKFLKIAHKFEHNVKLAMNYL